MDIERLTSTLSLHQLSIEEAVKYQYRLVDAISRYFPGDTSLSAGDFGLVHDLSSGEIELGGDRPRYTVLAERVLADFFGMEDAAMVPGAGTGAMRSALMACARPGTEVLIHRGPTYKTTASILDALSLVTVAADFNIEEEIVSALNRSDTQVALLQHIPQMPGDKYDVERVISCIRQTAGSRCTVLVDENYAALRVPRIGVEMGADLSAVSLFKLLGRPLVGCVLGSSRFISNIRTALSSGGSQVQGTDALDTLRGLVYCPVALAIQNEVTKEVARRVNDRLQKGVLPWARQVKSIHSLQCCHRNIVVVLKRPAAKALLKQCWVRGGASRPVGEESRYEVVPLFYRLSSNYLMADPELADYCIRINPFRSGPETIMRILEGALSDLDQGTSFEIPEGGV